MMARLYRENADRTIDQDFIDSEESEPMTLCVAAECKYDDRPAIGMCCDFRAQTGAADSHVTTGSDDFYKMQEIGQATVMLAGRSGMAKELVLACKPVIKKIGIDTFVDPNNFDLDVDALMRSLRAGAQKRKSEIIKHFVVMSVGIEFDEFKKLPSDNYLETWGEIRRLNLGADLLICFVFNEAIILRLDRWGDVHWEENYSAIGEGAESARSLLCLQPWHHSNSHGLTGARALKPVPLEQCLYRLFEAKNSAHLANPSSVGDMHSFQVLTQENRCLVSPEFGDSLRVTFARKHIVPPIDEDLIEKVLAKKIPLKGS